MRAASPLLVMASLQMGQSRLSPSRSSRSCPMPRRWATARSLTSLLYVCSGDGVALPPQRFSLSEVFDSFLYLIAPLRKNATRQRPVWCSNAMRRVVVREVEE